MIRVHQIECMQQHCKSSLWCEESSCHPYRFDGSHWTLPPHMNKIALWEKQIRQLLHNVKRNDAIHFQFLFSVYTHCVFRLLFYAESNMVVTAKPFIVVDTDVIHEMLMTGFVNFQESCIERFQWLFPEVQSWQNSWNIGCLWLSKWLM